MQQQEIFDSLVKNAFDFLEQGISEFEKSPKYSVIHFCAAVEMLLKARLMNEHWSLIVSKPDQANLNKFLAGDFISVTLEESRNRLRDIAGEEISDEGFNSFRSLANHRNKMIHFFHADMESDGDAKSQIVAEQCRSWFHLHILLKRWDDYFQDFSNEIRRANKSMNSQRKYLGAKFKALKKDLDAIRKSGSIPQICSACNFKAAIPKHKLGTISAVSCLVCEHSQTQIEMNCPHCNKPVVVENEGFATCKSCRGAIRPEHILDLLTDHSKAYIRIKDGDYSWEPANCGGCGAYHLVARQGDSYFCTNCFDISERITNCEWCNEPSTGRMSDSYVSGCGHCSGMIGHQKD